MFAKPIAHVPLVFCLSLAGAFTGATATAQRALAELTSDRVEMSLQAGGWQQFQLHAGPVEGNRWYLMLGSISGCTPGTRVQGVTIPLNYDVYTQFTLARPNAGFIRNQLGRLDPVGNATAAFFVPAGLSKDLVGLDINHAYVVIDESGRISAVSNPALLHLTR